MLKFVFAVSISCGLIPGIAPSHVAFAQTARFEHLTTTDGLSQRIVLCLLQDRRGFIWAGTQDGLNRFDGYKFKIFRKDGVDSSGLTSNYIWTLFEDSDGVLWVGTLGGGLCKFNPDTETFDSYLADEKDDRRLMSNNVLCITESPSAPGSLWIGTREGGLHRFDKRTGTFTRYGRRSNDSVESAVNYVFCIREDSYGDVWIGTVKRGLFRFDPRAETFQHIPNGHNDPDDLSIFALCEDSKKKLWIGTHGGGLKRYDRNTGSMIDYRSPAVSNLKSVLIRSLLEDSRGVLWVGTPDGLFEKTIDDSHTAHFVNYRHDKEKPGTLSHDYAISMCEDRGGTLWLGTREGINYFSHTHRPFQNLTVSDRSLSDLPSFNVNSIMETFDGTLWVGTEKGLHRWDSKSGSFMYLPNRDDRVTKTRPESAFCLMEVSPGELWIGTRYGLSRLDPRTGRFVRFFHDPSDPHSLSGNEIWDITRDRSGYLWIGTYGDGLNRAAPPETTSGTLKIERFKHDPNDPTSLSDNYVNKLLVDRTGNLWVGTSTGGLNKLASGSKRFERYRHEPGNPRSLGTNGVNYLFESRAGTLWIGTDRGLYKLTTDSTGVAFIGYTQQHGLSSDNVMSITEDDHGYLWIGSFGGIDRFEPESGRFVSYGLKDGLSSLSYNHRAVWRGRNGLLYFGGGQGIDVFHPDSVQTNSIRPPVYLTDLRVLNNVVAPRHGGIIEKSICMSEHMVLNHEDYFFSFEFTALNFRQPEKNRFAYRLEGFDNDWIVTTAADRKAVYTNVPHGRYTFRVKASNNDGVWNEEGVYLLVTVTPPWWDTWWARTAYAMFFVGAIGFLFRYQRHRLRQKETENRRLRELEVAKRIQYSIVPQIFHPFPDRTEFEVHGETYPARQVGGDFYDAFFVDQDRLGVVIGDVSDKGIPAALFMAVTKTLIQTTAIGLSPDRCLAAVNRHLCAENATAMFVTVFYGILNLKSGELEYACAGHELPFIRSNRTINPLEPTVGIALGVTDDIALSSNRVVLNTDDMLVMYTDGITESADPTGALFGKDRLRQCLESVNGGTAKEIARHVINAVRAFGSGVEAHDDLTVLAVRYKGRRSV